MPIANDQVSCCEIILHGLIAAGGSNSKNTVNIFHYKTAPNAAAISKPQIWNAFTALVVAPLAAALNVRWKAQNSTVRILDDATDVPQTFVETAIGGVAGDGMPLINTVYILLRTALRGKHYRGSKKFGPLSESDTALGQEDVLDPAAITRWGPVVSGIQSNFNEPTGRTWTPAIVSRKLSQLRVNPTTVVSNYINAALLKKSIGRLRRRQAKSVY